MTELLKFQKVSTNAKLEYMGKGAYTFSLLSGWACPGAFDCLSKVNRTNGKSSIEDGKHTKFRCFSASQEAIYPNVFLSRQHNYDLLKGLSTEEMVSLIEQSLPSDTRIVRVHVAGDMFNEKYFKAWITVANDNPNVIFYAYTKSLTYWVRSIDDIPDNLRLTASRGGRYDDLIDKHGLKSAEVVYSEQEAIDKGLEIDHDDRLAYEGTKSFALLIHGAQPKDSVAAKAVSVLRKQGITGYSKKNNDKKEQVNAAV